VRALCVSARARNISELVALNFLKLLDTTDRAEKCWVGRGGAKERGSDTQHKCFQNICNAWTDYYLQFRQAYSIISIVIFTETLDKIFRLNKPNNMVKAFFC